MIPRGPADRHQKSAGIRSFRILTELTKVPACLYTPRKNAKQPVFFPARDEKMISKKRMENRCFAGLGPSVRRPPPVGIPEKTEPPSSLNLTHFVFFASAFVRKNQKNIAQNATSFEKSLASGYNMGCTANR
jgi:hypothetical protein